MTNKSMIVRCSGVVLVAMMLTGFLTACRIALGKADGSAEKTEKAYAWTLTISPGKGCFAEACAEGQWPMAIVPLIAFDDKLWMVTQKSAWFSSDGVQWTAQPKTGWGERSGMTYVFFAGKIWMLGGMKTWDKFSNDVWSSSDGKEWKLATPNAQWSPRRNHGTVIFNHKIWVLGGALSSGRPDQTPSRFFNDVWSSADGVHWTQVTEHAPWSPRDGHISLVFDNKLWVIGGAGHRDVWSSADGRHWQQATVKAEWGERHSNGGVVFDEKLWIFGGRGLNDVRSSTDGAHRQMAFAQAPWSTRTTIHNTVYDNKLWIFGGKTGRADSWAGDVWAMAARK